MELFWQFYLEPALGYIVDSLVGLVAGAIVYVLLIPYRKQRLAHLGIIPSRHHEILLCLFMAYSGALLVLLISPADFLNGSGINCSIPSSITVEFVPTIFLILTGRYTLGTWTNAMFLGNVLLFIPLGISLMLLYQKLTCKLAVGIGLILSLSIEVIQIFTGRIFDINDIIYNILGTLLGTLLAHLIKKYFPSCSGKFCYE